MCYDLPMRTHYLEPGLLRVFRFYVVFQILFIFATVQAHYHRGLAEESAHHAMILGIVGTLLLFGYLSWPLLERGLGRFYLPLAIVFFTVFSLVLQNRFLLIHMSTAGISNEESAWQIFLILFIPMILCAWQYDFKAVIGYCLFSAVLDFALMARSDPQFNLPMEIFARLIFIRSLAFLITGYVIAYIMACIRKQRSSLEEANRNLAHYATTLEELTVSRERNRMARELHDTLAHTLSGIAVQLEAAQTVLPDSPGEARPLVVRSLEMTRSGLTETRRALQNLRASPLEELGLGSSLRCLAEAAAEQGGLKVEWEESGPLPKLPPDIEQGIYRIAQEAIQNIARHAGAHSLRVDWSVQGDYLELTIADDGQGFNKNNPGDSRHFGLRGMHERASMMGADLKIESQPGQGTKVLLKVRV
jgi:signal transduction histidine kinase